MPRLRILGNPPRLWVCLLASAWCATVALPGAAAAPIKVACIGEHTTHSHAFPADNREAQPVGKQEYPAQLQALLGPDYEVRNFGDCCATVLQGYTVGETHPYVNGSNNGDGVGFDESIAFQPDIVIIGSWGRHDWGLAKAPGQVFSLQGFQDGYDDLVARYQALPTKPKIFVSLPIPILNGEGDVANQGVKTSDVLPVVQTIAGKYGLPVVDLYNPFLGHKDLFKQPPDPRNEGEGEHVTDAGLTLIANAVYSVMQQELTQGGGGAGGGGTAGSPSGGAGAGGAAQAGAASAGEAGLAGGVSTAGTGQVGTGGQAGAEPLPVGAGTSGAAQPPAASDSGCACSLKALPASTGKTVLLLGALALLWKRRQRSPELGPGSAGAVWRSAAVRVLAARWVTRRASTGAQTRSS